MKTENQLVKNAFAELIALPWDKANIERVALFSLYCAMEFADTLRGPFVRVFGDTKETRALRAGELETDNLQFEDYNQKGDHWEFLFHFITKRGGVSGLFDEYVNTAIVGNTSLQMTTMLPDKMRAESIVAREMYLPGLFEKTLQNPEIGKVPFFKHYLERHIALDQGEHSGFVENFEVSDDVLRYIKLRKKFTEASIFS